MEEGFDAEVFKILANNAKVLPLLILPSLKCK